MKKILFLLLFPLLVLFSTTSLYAGTLEKGTISLGAGSNTFLSSTSWDDADYDRSRFNVSIEGGYFVANNMEVGAFFDFEKYKRETNISRIGDLEYTEISLVPFFAYHHPLNAKSNLFFRVGLGIGKYENNDTDYEEDFTTFLGEGGWEFFIKESFSMDIGLKYQIYNHENDYGLDATKKNLGGKLRFRLYL